MRCVRFVEKLRFDVVAAGVSPAKRGATDTVAATENFCAASISTEPDGV